MGTRSSTLFGLDTERLTAEVGRANAPLRPDRDFWVVSVDLLARNSQVQRKAIFAEEGAWDLVVFDEAHRLTPTAQNVFPMAEALARRCTHLLLLTATPHRGSEYLFRALLHLLDPDIYPWSPEDARLLGPDTPRLRPARVHFIRRMKESLRDHDNVTPLFPQRHAHNVPIPLSATEQQLYDDVLTYCDRYFEDSSGLVRSVYGKRGASSLYALSETLSRRADWLQGRESTALTFHMLMPILDPADLITEDEEAQSDLERRVNAVPSREISTEIATITELHDRINALISDPTFLPAKLQKVYQSVLPIHGITPGGREQILIFTEFTDTALWLEQMFNNRGFRVRRYAGNVSRDERERIQADFQDKKFEVLISTDAGNEGIDLQSAHVLVNWDIPWSIVRLEQRVGRLHRIGQHSKVDIYNLISTSTREGRVQEVILNNIVAAAEALNGQIFDFLGSVVEQLGIDYTALMVRAGAGGRAADEAVAEAQQVTAEQYQMASEEQRQVEDKLASLTNSDAFVVHSLQGRLDAVNPAVVTAFMQALAAARGWRMTAGLHENLHWIQINETKGQNTPLPIALGGRTRALVAMSADALVQARREGAHLAGAIVLGPAEKVYRELVDDIVRDANDVLAAGAILDDKSALTPYELLVFDAALAQRQGGRIVEWAYPLLMRADGVGVRVVSWKSVAHLSVPLSPQHHADFTFSGFIACVVLASFRWYIGLLFFVGWSLLRPPLRQLLRQRALLVRRATPELRHSWYYLGCAYRHVRRSVRVFGLGRWIMDRHRDKWLRQHGTPVAADAALPEPRLPLRRRGRCHVPGRSRSPRPGGVAARHRAGNGGHHAADAALNHAGRRRDHRRRDARADARGCPRPGRADPPAARHGANQHGTSQHGTSQHDAGWQRAGQHGASTAARALRDAPRGSSASSPSATATRAAANVCTGTSTWTCRWVSRWPWWGPTARGRRRW